MKNLAFLVVILILYILQITLLDFFRVFNVKPDLLLIAVVFASLIFDLRWALPFGVLSGVFKDTFSATTFGTNTLLFSLWSFLIFRLAKKISIDDDFRSAILIFIVSILHNIIIGLLFIYSGNALPLGIFLRIICISSIYTALVLPLIFRVINPIFSNPQ
jgi:rod shape-determining protein MreD